MKDYDLLGENEEYLRPDQELEEANKEIFNVSWNTENSSGSKDKITVFMDDDEYGQEKLQKGQYVDITKTDYVEGREIYDGEYGKLFAFTGEYKDQEVEFTLQERWHGDLKQVGGKGDTIRIRRVGIEDNENDNMFARFEFIKLDDE